MNEKVQVWKKILKTVLKVCIESFIVLTTEAHTRLFRKAMFSKINL